MKDNNWRFGWRCCTVFSVFWRQMLRFNVRLLQLYFLESVNVSCNHFYDFNMYPYCAKPSTNNTSIALVLILFVVPGGCFNDVHLSSACVTSAGQLLCGGLFSQDCLTVWFSAIALLHSINNSTSSSSSSSLKESLLQVHMAPATGGGGTPVTLMQQCFRLVCQVGHLMLQSVKCMPSD